MQVAKTLRGAALTGAAGLLIAIGLGFVTTGFYLFLLTHVAAITACLIVGAVYLGLGLLLIKLTLRRGPETLRSAPGSDGPMTPVILAFLDGMYQGMAAQKAGKSPDA